MKIVAMLLSSWGKSFRVKFASDVQLPCAISTRFGLEPLLHRESCKRIGGG